MKNVILFSVTFFALFLFVLFSAQVHAQSVFDYEVHDTEREQPPVVDPGAAPDQPMPVPSDAIVLFDGTDFSHWVDSNGEEPQWIIENGYMEVAPRTGSIFSKEEFGDIQLYVEWATPEEIEGDGQGRGNSGVFFMNRYEIQVLDSYDNFTYPDGMAASVYAQYPPLVNVSRAPGEWQNFNMIFRRPIFDPNGNLREPARVTVFHNNVLVHDNVPLIGPTGQSRAPYQMHEDKGPIRLQDHRDQVRFRNIWVRELPERRN